MTRPPPASPSAPRRNRVDPWGDLQAVPARGLLTGNRGCVVDDHERVVRHHGSQLWISCVLEFRGRRWPLARPRRWTPLFFLDDAVALAAGHRPCAACRRDAYRAYRDAVARAVGTGEPVRAADLDRRLRAERLRRGRGLSRTGDRLTWPAPYRELPDAAVVVGVDGAPRLVIGDVLLRFSFEAWTDPRPRPRRGIATVLTPATSAAALAHGFAPLLHPSVGDGQGLPGVP
ncbi:MAG: hypothetical protein ACFCVF_03355 [Kineosporiaceae bacterium]